MSRHYRNVAFGVLLLVGLCSSVAIADPITIVQHFGPATDPLNVDGVDRIVEGEWIFTLQGNLDGPDLRPDDDSLGMFSMSVSVSNSGLNLYNARVLSTTFYYELYYPDYGATVANEAGITDVNFLGRTTLFLEGNPLHNANLIERGSLNFIADGAAFLFDSSPLVLDNGITITGSSGTSAGSGQFGVPEPTTLVLLGSGLAVLVSFRRKLEANLS